MKIKVNASKILLVSVLFLYSEGALSQPEGWQWQNPYLQGNDLNSIVMNGSIGWAVGAMGTVMKTTNEGFDWELIDLGTSENFNSIYMDGISGRGWIVGNSGLIFFTDDGGNTWVKQRSGTQEILYSVTAIEGACPWICGNDIILKSHDHGENWEWVPCIFHSHYFSIDLKDCDNAWICGQQGLVISTSDEGATWQSHPTAVNQNLYSIDIVANGDYRSCGYGGNIIRSSDAGSTWVKEFEQTFLYLYNVDTKGIGGPAYAVGGDGTILETLNGGTTWNKRESGVFTYLNDVCFQAIMHGVYATGWYGIILRKEDEPGAEFEIMNERPVHFMMGLDFIDKNTGWAVGGKEVDDDTEEGVIMHTSDGGATWEVQKTLAEPMMAVDFINAQEGWAIGDYGKILHTLNGGQTWTSQTSPITGLMTSVFFINEEEGWIVSRDNWGEIVHTTNGGSTWTLQPEYSLNPLNDVFFINPDTGWAVGMDTTVMRTLDGGQTWLNCDVDVYGNPYMRSVQFTDEMKGVAVGTGGAILMSNDGGAHWQEIQTGFSDLLQSVCFVDPLNGWASGTDGNVLRTIDGGYTWFKQYTGMHRYITAVCFVDPLCGWIAGEGGAVKGTTNGGFWNEPGVFHNKWMEKPIQDNAETKDTINVKVLNFREAGYELVGVELMLDSILHPRISDLEISLTHDGITAVPVSHPAGPGANILWMRLKDDATKQIADGAAPYSGDYKPQTLLGIFNGLDPDGEWILTIGDNQAGSTGMLKAWGVKPLFDRKVGIEDPVTPGKPDEIILLQNVPNPFSGITRISWTSEVAGRTILKIYDNQGRELETLVDEFKPKGEYSVEFNGSHFSPGVYCYRLQVGDVVLTRKCIIK
ncbi:MAG TPA: YCF48-related protein [Bacteroidales bacterium]|nr:YCF48-related protein [Bacteroidales bacterium]HPM00516.1 YCF48-related protein [Candidatus Cloacimonadota bacterium]